MLNIRNKNIVPTLGFGDFLRGSITLWELSQKEGYSFAIDYSEHPIASYLDNTHTQESPCTSSITICDNEYPKLLECLKNCQEKYIDFTTNVWNFLVPISTHCASFFQESLIPKPEFEVKITHNQMEMGLDKPFSVLHLRLGDSVLVHGNSSNCNYEGLYTRAIHALPPNERVFLISDDINAKRFFKQKQPERFVCLLKPVAHLALQTDNTSAVEVSLLEFFIMSRSTKIYQYTTYSWPSGFSRWCAEIFQIPVFSI